MFKSIELQKKYEARLSRYITAMHGGTPDRIPIRFFFQEAAARFAGYTSQQVACNYNLAFDATREMAISMDSDAVMLNAIWSNYGVGKAAGWRYLNVPGVDVSGDSVLQYSEPEREEDMLMFEDEYDEFSSDPTAFLYGKWLSRYANRIKAPGGAVDAEHNMTIAAGAMAYANYMNAFGPAAYKLKYEAGVVSANSGMIKAPLDIFSDKLRGYLSTAIDTLERPEQVLKACEALMPHLLANALGGADPDGLVPVTLWAHRGCTPFFSKETFEKIFWPTLKPLLEEIIAAGHQVLFYGEGNWEAHYDSLLELPAGGIIYHLDKGDPILAAKKLKGKFALSGGLNYDVLSRGTTDDVRLYMKKLLSEIAADGGYILDCSALMLNDIKPENVRTAVDYILDHGVYSSGHEGFTPLKVNPLITKNVGIRPPNTCISWERESSNYRNLSGDLALVKRSWQAVDSAAYNYIWTTLLW
ncbi:MAG: Uroporphyrinogen-III decarboxylase [Clostridia bacterium]|nr:Uroporphyrinogen-III decarboxylase [Clostridia bacterium]